MSYQKITVVGNLGQNAEIRTTNSSKAIGFSIAVNKKYVDNDGVEQNQTLWFNCSKWVKDGQSAKVAEFLKKGTLVCVDGEISVNTYKSKITNEWTSSINIRVDQLSLLSSASDKEADSETDKK